MARIIVRSAPPGSVIYGTPGADDFDLFGFGGITIIGLGGADTINPGIPNPNTFRSYTTIYGDGVVHGSPFQNFLEGDWVGNDRIAFGWGYIAKGGPGRDRYDFHGRGDDNALIAQVPQLDIDRDVLVLDRTDDRRWTDGFHASDWDVIRLDADSFRVRGVKITAESLNPIVDHQAGIYGFLPSGHGEDHHYFDVAAETPHMAMVEANTELHEMAQEGDFLL